VTTNPSILGAAPPVWLRVVLLTAGLAVAASLQAQAPAPDRTELIARIRTLETDQRALPDSSAIVDVAIEFLARRGFHALGRGEKDWNAENPKWQSHFPQYRVEFAEALRRVVSDYELRAAVDTLRVLNKVLLGLSDQELDDLKKGLDDARVLSALGTMQRAVPVVIRGMGAEALPESYSAAEIEAVRQEVSVKLGAIEPGEVADRLAQPALTTYRERILSALTDTSELENRLDSPVLRADLDALGQRWRERMGSR
jgi:hypothetical protein